MSENNEILFNNEYFMKSLSTIININKELEKEIYSNEYDEKEDILKDNIKKTIINSIFSLLNFQITIISQLAELNSQFSEKSEINQQQIIEKLVNFTKELLYQKIKQIVMLYHNNIIYKNYIDNSSSLKINNDKHKKKKNQLINLNESNFFINNNNSLEINNKVKKPNKIIDKEINSKNKDKTQINLKNSVEKENQNEKMVKFQTPVKYEKINNYKRTIFIKNNKKGNIQNNINNNNKLNNTVFHNYNTTKLSKKKIKNQTIKNNTLLGNDKIHNNISQEEINPIRKIKNIIKNIKINSSISNKKYKNKNKRNNIFTHDKNINSLIFNYSNDSMNNQESQIKNSFSYHGTENNEKVEKNFINKLNKKDIETSHILNECMNNVKKRLAVENEKNNKKEEQKNLTDRNIYEYKNMKNHKIKKQLCINLYKNK